MSMYENTLPQISKMLRNLDAWLEKATATAESRKFDVNNLFGARLAPDQLPFHRQVQIACDHAKFIAARMSGKTPPSFPDTETNVAELRTRIATTLDYLGTFTAEDFVGAEERQVHLAFMPGQHLLAADYLHEFGLPNFYFHVTTAYAILRHNGVDLGKRDFIGSARMRPNEAS